MQIPTDPAMVLSDESSGNIQRTEEGVTCNFCFDPRGRFEESARTFNAPRNEILHMHTLELVNYLTLRSNNNPQDFLQNLPALHSASLVGFRLNLSTEQLSYNSNRWWEVSIRSIKKYRPSRSLEPGRAAEGQWKIIPLAVYNINRRQTSESHREGLRGQPNNLLSLF